MSIVIKEILADLYEIDPDLAEKEEELKKIIDKLLSSKPDVTMDDRFRVNLKEKILKKISKKRPGIITWAFKNKFRIAIAAAAGVFSAVLIFSVLLPIINTLQTHENTKYVSSPQDKDPDTVPGMADTEIASTEESEDTESKPEEPKIEEKKTEGMRTEGDEDIVFDVDTGKEKGREDTEKEVMADTNDAQPDDSKDGIIKNKEEPSEIVLFEEISDEFINERRVAEEEEAPITVSGMTAEEQDRDMSEGEWNTEEYDRIYENRFLSVRENPESTFSIDVDTASYSNVRRYLKNNQLPYKDAVRIEELLNYFDYDYPEPSGTDPFAFFTETAPCPWNNEHRLIHIGIQGRNIPNEQLPPSNLVFLIDVSGSMNDSNKLPLLKRAFSLLVNELREQDRVAIVVYAGAAGLVLPSTPGNQKAVILDSLHQLSAGGSTAGGAGIRLAYETAKQYFLADGNNRIILATDGDFNIGVSSDAELTRLIEEKRDMGIYLTVLGFGMGNYKDSKMEKLADKGNGNYAYIDTFNEAKKVFGTELGSTLLTIAKDVKIQIEFNPVYIDSYRLIGYENRILAKEDFADDTKDAGELGAGHTVTALYEIIPVTGAAMKSSAKDELIYQETTIKEDAYNNFEIMTLKFRYKKPEETTSILIEVPVIDTLIPLSATSDNFRFSAAVAAWGLLLRDSEYKGETTYDKILDLAQGAKGQDKHGYRAEFIELVEMSKVLAGLQ